LAGLENVLEKCFDSPEKVLENFVIQNVGTLICGVFFSVFVVGFGGVCMQVHNGGHFISIIGSLYCYSF